MTADCKNKMQTNIDNTHNTSTVSLHTCFPSFRLELQTIRR